MEASYSVLSKCQILLGDFYYYKGKMYLTRRYLKPAACGAQCIIRKCCALFFLKAARLIIIEVCGVAYLDAQADFSI